MNSFSRRLGEGGLVLSLALPLFLWALSCRADVAITIVKYATRTTAFLEAGRLQGLQSGDSGEVWRNDSLIARMVVVYVSDNSASCKLLDGAGTVRADDRAKVFTRIAPALPQPPEPTVVKAITQNGYGLTAYGAPKNTKTKVSGYLGVQYYLQNDQSALNYDYRQPSLISRLRLGNIQGTNLNFSFRMRSRWNQRSSRLSSSPGSKWEHRLYELRMEYDDPGNRYRLSVGRQTSNRISGIGYLDGITGRFNACRSIEVGAFFGAEPDFTGSTFGGNESKTGLFATYSTGENEAIKYDLTAAVAGIYRGKEIDREFIYEQSDLSLGRILSLYHSAEVEVNRGWRERAAGKTLDLADLTMSLRWMPGATVSTTFGYDQRKPIRSYETRSVPDSLFDDAQRQGVRAGVSLWLPRGMRLMANAGIRTGASQGTAARNGSATLGAGRWMPAGTDASYRFGFFSSLLSSGSQHQLSLSREVNRTLRVELQTGLNSYRIKSQDLSRSSQWGRLGVEQTFAGRIQTSISYELTRGDQDKSGRLFAEAGVRF